MRCMLVGLMFDRVMEKTQISTRSLLEPVITLTSRTCRICCGFGKWGGVGMEVVVDLFTFIQIHF